MGAIGRSKQNSEDEQQCLILICSPVGILSKAQEQTR
jgi:hypothetical protein